MEDLKEYPVSLDETIHARAVVGQHLKQTSLTRYVGLSELLNADVYVKHENHNPTGSFKIRNHLRGKRVVLQMSGCNASPEEITRAIALPEFSRGIITAKHEVFDA